MSGTMRTILITGASSGMGKLAAMEFLRRGWIVYAAARRVDRMEELRAGGGHPLRMDVTDESSIRDGVARMINDTGRIDVLFANAGYGSYGTIESVPIAEVIKQFDVNLFGVGRTVQAVLPSMRQVRSGRIIITSSVAAHISTSGIGYYSATKHALRAVGRALRQEVGGMGIRVSMIEPGILRTGFEEVAQSALDALDPHEDYQGAHDNILAYVTRGFQSAPGPEHTVRVVYRAATVRRPRPIYRTTRDARLLPLADRLVSPRLADRISLSLQNRARWQLRRSPDA